LVLGAWCLGTNKFPKNQEPSTRYEKIHGGPVVLAAALKINRWYLISACVLCLGILAIPITLAFRSSSPASLLPQFSTLNTPQTASRTVQLKTGEVKKSLILDGELRALRAKTIWARLL
jgi:hypothetical protein